jgi:hypothetical protein
MNQYYPPDWTYADFAAQFRAELWGKYFENSILFSQSPIIYLYTQIPMNGLIYLLHREQSMFMLFLLQWNS